MAISSISGVQPTYMLSPMIKPPVSSPPSNTEVSSARRLDVPTVPSGAPVEQWVVFRVGSATTPFMPFDDDGSLVLRQQGPSPGMVLDLKMVDVSIGSNLHIIA